MWQQQQQQQVLRLLFGTGVGEPHRADIASSAWPTPIALSAYTCTTALSTSTHTHASKS